MLLLKYLNAGIPKYKRHSTGPTLVVRRRIWSSSHRDFTVSFHNFCGLGLQNRIRVIANELINIAYAVRARTCHCHARRLSTELAAHARTVPHRARARHRWLNIRITEMGPNSREIWHSCGLCCSNRMREYRDRERHGVAALIPNFPCRCTRNHRADSPAMSLNMIAAICWRLNEATSATVSHMRQFGRDAGAF